MEAPHLWQLVDEFESIVDKSFLVMGKRHVNEAAFFAAMQQIRVAVTELLPDISDTEKNQLFRPFYEISVMMENSSGLLGKRAISEELFFVLMEKFRSLLAEVLKKDIASGAVDIVG